MRRILWDPLWIQMLGRREFALRNSRRPPGIDGASAPPHLRWGPEVSSLAGKEKRDPDGPLLRKQTQASAAVMMAME